MAVTTGGLNLNQSILPSHTAAYDNDTVTPKHKERHRSEISPTSPPSRRQIKSVPVLHFAATDDAKKRGTRFYNI